MSSSIRGNSPLLVYKYADVRERRSGTLQKSAKSLLLFISCVYCVHLESESCQLGDTDQAETKCLQCSVVVKYFKT